jgi:GDP-fucose transporter C1
MSAYGKDNHRNDDASESDSATSSQQGNSGLSSSSSSLSSSSNAKENNATSAGGAPTSTVVLAMSFYMAVSIALVFANKFVLSDKSLDAPLFLTWTQLVIAVLACFAIAQIKPLFAPHLNFFPRFEYRLDRAKAVMPLSLIFIGMVYVASPLSDCMHHHFSQFLLHFEFSVFNNMCLKYVEVSFYQVARSLTILANIGLTYLLLGKSTSTVSCH